MLFSLRDKYSILDFFIFPSIKDTHALVQLQTMLFEFNKWVINYSSNVSTVTNWGTCSFQHLFSYNQIDAYEKNYYYPY